MVSIDLENSFNGENPPYTILFELNPLKSQDF